MLSASPQRRGSLASTTRSVAECGDGRCRAADAAGSAAPQRRPSAGSLSVSGRFVTAEHCAQCRSELTPQEVAEYGVCFLCHLRGGAGSPTSVSSPSAANDFRRRHLQAKMCVSVVDPTGTLRSVESFVFLPSTPWSELRPQLLQAMALHNQVADASVVASRLRGCDLVVGSDVVEDTRTVVLACMRGPTVVKVVQCSSRGEGVQSPTSAQEQQRSAGEETVTRRQASDSCDWKCDSCGFWNAVKPFASYKAFVKHLCGVKAAVPKPPLSIIEMQPLIVCNGCGNERLWECLRPACGAKCPSVISKPTGQLFAWMTCLMCSSFRLQQWQCPHCSAVNVNLGEAIGVVSELCKECGRSGAMLAMYHWLHAQRAPVVITAAAPVAASQQLSRVSDSVVAEGRHSVSTDTSAPRHAPVRQPPPRPATVPSPQSDVTDGVEEEVSEDVVSSPLDLSVVMDDFGDSSAMRLHWRSFDPAQQYVSFQRIRHDGNSFYRALVLSLLQSCIVARRGADIQQLADRLLPSVAVSVNGPAVIGCFQNLAVATSTLLRSQASVQSALRKLRLLFETNSSIDWACSQLLRDTASRFMLVYPDTKISADGTTFASCASLKAKSLIHYCRDTMCNMAEDGNDCSAQALAHALGIRIRIVYVYQNDAGSGVGCRDYPYTRTTVPATTVQVSAAVGCGACALDHLAVTVQLQCHLLLHNDRFHVLNTERPPSPTSAALATAAKQRDRSLVLQTASTASASSFVPFTPQGRHVQQQQQQQQQQRSAAARSSPAVAASGIAMDAKPRFAASPAATSASTRASPSPHGSQHGAPRAVLSLDSDASDGDSDDEPRGGVDMTRPPTSNSDRPSSHVGRVSVGAASALPSAVQQHHRGASASPAALSSSVHSYAPSPRQQPATSGASDAPSPYLQQHQQHQPQQHVHHQLQPQLQQEQAQLGVDDDSAPRRRHSMVPRFETHPEYSGTDEEPDQGHGNTGSDVYDDEEEDDGSDESDGVLGVDGRRLEDISEGDEERDADEMPGDPEPSPTSASVTLELEAVSSTPASVPAPVQKRVFLSNLMSDARLTRLTTGLPALSDDYHVPLDVWEVIVNPPSEDPATLRPASAATSRSKLSDTASGIVDDDDDTANSMRVLLIHGASNRALSFSSRLLSCRAKPELHHPDSEWRLTFKSDDVACTLRHITSGQLLAVVDDEAVMIRGCEAGQKHHLWKLLSAE